jgi:hypothetical protein
MTTPLQPATSVINPEHIIVPVPLLPLSLPEVPLVVTPVSTFVESILILARLDARVTVGFC